MPPEFDTSIDTSQTELTTEAGKENTGEIKKADDIFKVGGLVDQFQGLDKTLKITSGESKNYFEKGKGEVSKLLVRMAVRGQWLVDNPGNTTAAPPEESKKPGEKKKESPKETERIDTLASSLRTTLDQYSKNLATISEINKKRTQAFSQLENVWQMQASAEVINVAPNIPDSYVTAIGNMLYGVNGESGMYEVLRMLKVTPNLPDEYIKECQINFNEKNINQFMEIRIRGLQQQAIYNMQFEGEMLGKYIGMEHGKKPGDKPTFTWSSEGEKLPEEKKQQLLLILGGIRVQEEENRESATCPKITEKFWAGKAFLETGRFEDAKTALEAFLKDDLPSLANDKNLKSKKDSYEKRAKDMLEQIESINGDNKDFFEAQKLAQSGDIFGAKKLLKKYLKDHEKPEEGKTNFNGSAKELLKNIALMQVEDAKEQFKIHEEPKRTILVSKRDPYDPEHKGTIMEEEDNPEYAKWDMYRGALARIEQMVKDGKYDDFTDAYNAILREQLKDRNQTIRLSQDDDFNVLHDQITMDKGREGLLELARKYREKGKYFGDTKYLQVAEQYFGRYFSGKLNETANKYVTIEALRSKYYSNPTVQAAITDKFNEPQVQEEVKKRYDEACKKNPEWAASHPWSDYCITARNAIADKVFEGMRVDETVKQQNSFFQSDAGSVGDATDQAAWGEFMNMKGYHGQGKWYEPFAMSDEQVSHLVKDLPVDIAIIAAASAIAAATGGAASGLVLEAGMSVAEREALAFGVRAAWRQAAAYSVGLLTETTVFTVSNSVLQGVRTGKLSIADWKTFREEWVGNLVTLGGLGLVGRASAALKLGKLSSFGVEMAGMGAMQGKLGIDDFAMVLGLKVGHAVPEVVKAAKGKPGEKAKKAEAKPTEKPKAQEPPKPETSTEKPKAAETEKPPEPPKPVEVSGTEKPGEKTKSAEAKPGEPPVVEVGKPKAAVGVETGIDYSALDHEAVQKALQAKEFSTRQLIDALKTVPELAKLFEADAGVKDKISIETHVERVTGQYEKFLADTELPPGVDKNFFRVMFALHDIGKPRSLEKGDKSLQHEDTVPIIRDTLHQLGYDQAHIDLMTALVDGDPIGEAIRKKKTPKEAAAEIEKMAQRANMPIDQFYKLLDIFYKADASSYTSEAGGAPSLDKVFSFDKEKGTMDYSPKTKESVDLLSAQIEKIRKAREMGMVSEDEVIAYAEKHKTEIAAEAEDLLKLDAPERNKRILEMMGGKEKVKAIALVERLNALMGDSAKGTERESGLDNIDAYRKQEAKIQETLARIEEIRKIKDKDAQYSLMTMLYNENPALYMASMERITYDLDIDISRRNRDAKIGEILKDYQTPEDIEALNRLQRRVETEIIPGMLDTHGTDLNAVFGLIAEGGMDTPHERKKEGKNVKGTGGDDIKLAGSLSIFSYLGSFWEVTGKDVLITFNHEYVDSKGPNDSFYTTEDYLLKPTKDLDPDREAVRMSYDEKLNDVLKRQDMKRYLSYKIADYIFREAKRKNVPVDQIPQVDLANGFAAYLRANSDITGLSPTKLGGRPEGHLKFEIPIHEMSIQVPKEKVSDLLAEIQKQKAVFDKQLNGADPETALDSYKRREYKMLQALEARFQQALGINPDMSMRELVLYQVQETIAEQERILAADPTNKEAKKVLDRLRQFHPDQVTEYEKGGLNSNRDYKRKEYLEKVLGIRFSDQVAIDRYGKVDVVKDEGTAYVYSEEPGFLDRFANYLQSRGIDKSRIKKENGALSVTGAGDLNIAQMARDYLPLDGKEAKNKQPKKPKEATALDPRANPEILKVLQAASLDKKAVNDIKQTLISRGAEALPELTKKYNLSDATVSALQEVISRFVSAQAVEKKAA